MAQDDDSFGLPDLNYKPLEPKKETPPSTPKVEKKVEKAPTTTTRIQSAGNPVKASLPKPPEPQDDKSRVLVGILVPIIILVAAYFGYLYLYQKPKEAKAKQEQEARDAEARKKKADEEAARLAREKEEADRLAREAENAKPAIGTIETLTAQTGRWYVVAASSIDDDLIMDEAQRQSVKGVSTKIIPPFGKWKYFRMTISDHDTFALADASAKELAAQYNGALWVMKY
jgi:hypothetical protein